VYVWGINHYRSSYPTLAYIPENSIGEKEAWRYFAGNLPSGAPIWSDSSSKAKPSFFSRDGDQGGCIGEFSIAWIGPMESWLMLYNCALGGPGTIRARLAKAPWGPWSEPAEIFRPDTDSAWCRYMHADANYSICSDQAGGENGADHRGDPYAPFILSRFTRATAQGAEIYFLMSTWNPYQVVVMRTNLTALTH